MNTRLFVLLLAILSTGCEKISPFISNVLWDKRMDVDGDKIPRPDDCDDRDPDPKVSVRIWYRDVDQDGFGAGEKIIACNQPSDTTANNADCDDVKASVYPNAIESCDHLDNDCDAQTDETFTDLGESCGVGACAGGMKICASDQASTTCSSTTNANSESCNLIDDDCDSQTDEGTETAYYHDADKDGFGNVALKHLRCLPLPGETTNATDCDDAHASSYPNAPEFCDGLDNDCNGQTDESTAIDAKTLYADVDQDTYGNVFVTKKSCVAESGWSLTNNDCKDLEKAIHPNALELCNLIDDDCNGKTDEAFSDLGSTCGVGACAGGMKICASDQVSTTCSSTANASSELCDGIDNDCDSKTDETFTDLGSACGVGACAGGMYVCASDKVSTTCSSTGNASAELCDGIDNNCDSQTDEASALDVKTWYVDFDKDEFGSALVTKLACEKPVGFVANKLDCNDNAVSISPIEKELCNTLDDDCNGQTDEGVKTVFFADVDQDTYGNSLVTQKACSAPSGYVENDTDCKDLDKLIHPNATEVCNLIDDNCNGQTDEGVIKKYFADTDKDTFGNLSEDVTGCTAPSGFVTNSTDCNDKQKTVYPNAIELCDNNVDENCDGITDNAKEATLWYLDADKDTYGTKTVSLYACATPTGSVANNTDCDDANPKTHPNTIEICKDDIDNDCNGVTDTDTKVVTWYLDFDQDGFGDATKLKQDCAKPAEHVENKDDCNDLDKLIHPKATEVCNNGTDDNCDGSVNQCFLSGVIKIGNANTIQIAGSESQNFAAAVSTCDLNDDGSPDLVIGSPAWNGNQGKVSLYVSPLKSGMNATQEILGATNSLFGTSVACTGSKNGPMLAVGSPGLAAGGNSAGALYLFTTSILKSTSTTDAQAIVIGTAQNMEVGVSCVAIPDQDKDSLNDFFVGADGYNGGTGAFAGAGFVVSSATLGTVLIQNALASFINKTKDELAGTSLAVGFLNQDTKLDFLLGSISSDVAQTDAGAVYVHMGPLSGSVNTTDTNNIYGISPFDTLGQSLASSFDLTGDMLDDVLIGSPGNGNAQNPGSVQIAMWNTKSSNPTFLVTTLESMFGGDRLGFSVSSGNVNTDLFGDILVGAPGADDAGFNAGSVFLQYGPILNNGDIRKTAHARIDGEATSGQLGWLTKIAPDLSGDNIPDLILVTKSTKPLRKLYILPGLGL